MPNEQVAATIPETMLNAEARWILEKRPDHFIVVLLEKRNRTLGFVSKQVVASLRDSKCQRLGETLLREYRFKNKASSKKRHVVRRDE
jgi:hypothetical protein